MGDDAFGRDVLPDGTGEMRRFVQSRAGPWSARPHAALRYRSHDESWAFSKFQRTIFDRPPRHLAVIERNRVIGKFLIGLVALPGDENDVARLGQGDGAGDRFCAVGDGFEISGAKSFLTSAIMASGSSFRGLSEVMML